MHTNSNLLLFTVFLSLLGLSPSFNDGPSYNIVSQSDSDEGSSSSDSSEEGSGTEEEDSDPSD